MTRVFAHHVHQGIAWLGLWEAALTTVLITIMLTYIDSAMPPPAALNADVIRFAATLALTASVIAVTIGWYRPSVFGDPWRLLAATTITSITVVISAMAISGTQINTLDSSYIGWLIRGLAVWLAVVVLTRLVVATPDQRPWGASTAAEGPAAVATTLGVDPVGLSTKVILPRLPFYDVRANIKLGITGWAQANYPYGASVEDARGKLAYDLNYAKNKSLLLDLLILCAPMRVILFQEGAR